MDELRRNAEEDLGEEKEEGGVGMEEDLPDSELVKGKAKTSCGVVVGPMISSTGGKIYPVQTLGIPYQAEDGALKGDSSGRTVYQTCSAVRTACTGQEGGDRFPFRGKPIAVNEMVFMTRGSFIISVTSLRSWAG